MFNRSSVSIFNSLKNAAKVITNAYFDQIKVYCLFWNKLCIIVLNKAFNKETANMSFLNESRSSKYAQNSFKLASIVASNYFNAEGDLPKVLTFN